MCVGELHAKVCRSGPCVSYGRRVGCCRRGVWLSETTVAFAHWCLCGVETVVAFAGEKWAFLVRFSGAEVMAVSAVPCWGRAVVLLVSTSPCFCVLCAVFVALRAHNGQKLAFDGALGKYFRGSAVVGSRRESLLCRVPGIRPIYWQC